MANTGVTVEIPAPPKLRGRGGLLDTLRPLGLVREYTDDVPESATQRQRDGEDELPGGLLAATRDNIAWMASSQHRPIGCGDVDDWVECSDGSSYVEKVAGEQPENPTQQAWQLVANDACSMFSVTYDERVERARENLIRKQSNKIADELWHGTINAAEGWSNLTLAGSATALTVTATPLSYALGALQEALAECLGDGQAGMIHASRTAVTAWWADGSLYWQEQEGVLYDVFGNVIVSSGAYDGADPDGVVSETEPWAYATGPVVARLGPVMVIPDAEQLGASIDRQTNDLTVWAERSVSYQFDPCCVFGIPVDICNTCCSPSGS